MNYLIIQFNFCPEPLNKANVFKVNLEVEENNFLKDVIQIALHSFNTMKKTTNNEYSNLTIVENSKLYQIRLSKKSGLPDMDLPAINENLKLKELNHLNFSIAIEDKHIIILPKIKFNDDFDTMSVMSVALKQKQSQIESKKYLKEPLLEVNKRPAKKKCWANCFGMLKNK